MLEKMLKDFLNNPIVITKEQLDNIRIFIKETEEGIDTISIDEYITLKVTDKLLTLLNRGD